MATDHTEEEQSYLYTGNGHRPQWGRAELFVKCTFPEILPKNVDSIYENAKYSVLSTNVENQNGSTFVTLYKRTVSLLDNNIMGYTILHSTHHYLTKRDVYVTRKLPKDINLCQISNRVHIYQWIILTKSKCILHVWILVIWNCRR